MAGLAVTTKTLSSTCSVRFLLKRCAGYPWDEWTGRLAVPPAMLEHRKMSLQSHARPCPG